jgi:lysophospholipase L1-like esterase
MKVLFILVLFSGMINAQTERTMHWQQRNKQFNSEYHNLPEGRIIFLGNSITEGFDLNKYFPDEAPINRAIAGDHLDGLLERLDSSVVLLKPSRIYLLIGINDIGRGDVDSLILARYNMLLTRFHKDLPGTQIFVNSILPTSAKWSNCPREKIIRLNEQIQEMTESFQYNWINIYLLFAGPDGYIRDAFTNDGLHLNQAGYEVWSSQLQKTGLH